MTERTEEFGDFSLESTDAGAARDPHLELYRNSASPANADKLGALEFYGEDASGDKLIYGSIEGRIDDVTNGSEDGGLNFYNMTAGTETLRGSLNSAGWSLVGTLGVTGAVTLDTTLGVVGAATILNATAIPANGTAGSGYKFSSTANFGIFFGSGAPTLVAAKGSLYLRSDGGGVNDRAYIATDAAGTWTAIVTVG